MLRQFGADNVREQKDRALQNVSYDGPDRLVKVLPVTRHSEIMKPSSQYPMGGGGLQWTLIKPCEFLLAVHVDSNGIARTPSFSLFLGESAMYDERAKLARYLEKA